MNAELLMVQKIDYGPCTLGDPVAVIAGACLIFFGVLALGEGERILAITKRLSLDYIGSWLCRQNFWQRQLIALFALFLGFLFGSLGLFGSWGHCPKGA